MDEDSICACLEATGERVSQPGDEVPILSAVEAIGVGDGGIGPGDYAAAVFLVDSLTDAQDLAQQLEEFQTPAFSVGRVVVGLDPLASQELRDQIEACVTPA